MKIVTALNNPEINLRLKKENTYEIIGKDIQYKEAILEILEKNSKIDLIIINYKLPGQIRLEDLINKIKEKNNKIKIIMLLKEKEKNKISYFRKLGIKEIHIIDKINYYNLLKILNDKGENKDIHLHKSNINLQNKKFKNIILIQNNEVRKEEIVIELILKYLITKNNKILLIKINTKHYKNNYNKIRTNISKYIKIINYNFKKYKNNYKEIENLLDNNKENFDFIFIQIETLKEFDFYKKIIKKINCVLFFMKSDITGITRAKRFIEKFKSDFLIQNIDLQIIEHKNGFYSISTKLLQKFFGTSLKKFSININKKERKKILKMISNIKLNLNIKRIILNIYKESILYKYKKVIKIFMIKK